MADELTIEETLKRVRSDVDYLEAALTEQIARKMGYQARAHKAENELVDLRKAADLAKESLVPAGDMEGEEPWTRSREAHRILTEALKPKGGEASTGA